VTVFRTRRGSAAGAAGAGAAAAGFAGSLAGGFAAWPKALAASASAARNAIVLMRVPFPGVFD
jgi:hypothetical protein